MFDINEGDYYPNCNVLCLDKRVYGLWWSLLNVLDGYSSIFDGLLMTQWPSIKMDDLNNFYGLINRIQGVMGMIGPQVHISPLFYVIFILIPMLLKSAYSFTSVFDLHFNALDTMRVSLFHVPNLNKFINIIFSILTTQLAI